MGLTDLILTNEKVKVLKVVSLSSIQEDSTNKTNYDLGKTNTK